MRSAKGPAEAGQLWQFSCIPMWRESAMKDSRVVLAVLFVVAVTFPSLRAETRSPDDNHVKLTGCLVKGESGDRGYLITSLPSEPASPSTAEGAAILPSAIG